MSFLRIGTCSWKYDSWRGLVYSDKQPINYLQEYARMFNTVEIDQWFWSLFGVDKIALPSSRVVESYLHSVPDDFKFTIKIPNSITLTHFYRKHKQDPLVVNPHFLSAELAGEFFQSIEILKEHLGMLMFQFEYLNKLKMASQPLFQEKLGSFLSQIGRRFPCAVEIRNPNYLNDKYFRLLNELNVGHVFLQGYFMPDIVEIYKKFKSFIKDAVVIRLHGPDRSDIEKKSGGKWDRILEPKNDQLIEIGKMIKDLIKNKVTVYVNVNNHYEGSAPLTIKRLEKILEESLN